MRIFDSYVSESSLDEIYDDKQAVKACWKEIIDNIEEAGLDVLKEKQAEIDWHLENNGVTYNIYDDNDKPSNRLWKFDPIPFVIKGEEWAHIRKGLQQRAKLFNLILRDLYSEQRLIKDNIIPAEVVFAHKGFATEVFDFGFKDDFNLNLYAADIARGPDGKMWVISDKTQAPSGLGYTIENRLTMNVVATELYPDIEIRRLAPFLGDYKELLKDLTGGDISKAAFLTPGPHNATYFEHAYLSSHLGIDLVQGENLLTKNNALWRKNLSGLKEVKTVLSRVNDRYTDPLELNNNSKLGVAGLVGAMRNNNVNMVNPIGSAVAENVGLNPFMKKIAQYFLQEELILPQIATWWCGQKKALEYVLKNLDKLIIKKIDRTEKIQIYFGKQLSEDERAELAVLLNRSPHQYVAQEEVEFSTVPYYSNGKIEPRKTVIRAFCLKRGDAYSVMNGGLVRMSNNKENLFLSVKQGGISKDLWILGKETMQIDPVNTLEQKHYSETSIEQISTLKAENLFWLGRYLSRSIATTRLILHVIKKITNFYRYEVATSKESQLILHKALTHMTMTYPGFLDTSKQDTLEAFPMDEITSVVKNANRSGSLSFTISMLSIANINLKDILTSESWNLFTQLQKEWAVFSNRKFDSTLTVASELEKTLIYLMAYKELVNESIFKEQGLILYDIGYKIEAALLMVSKARSMLCLRLDKAVEHDVLEAMLNSIAGFNAYRAHYKSAITLENVIEFLLLNAQYPKSLMYMTHTLLEDFALLPKAKITWTKYEKTILTVQGILESMDAKRLLEIKDEDGVYSELDTVLSRLSDLYLECSDAFSHTYFSHNDE